MGEVGMVNKLSILAQFLEDESLPSWLKAELQNRREEITEALARGKATDINGPNGEVVTIAPQAVSAVA
jgi:hypothetical protein